MNNARFALLKLDGFGLNIAKNVLTTLTNLLDKFTESTKCYLILNEAVNKHRDNKENLFTSQHQTNVNASLKVSNFKLLSPHSNVRKGFLCGMISLFLNSSKIRQ